MSHLETETRQRIAPRTPTDPDLVDRLARLRTILPLIATDLAAARRRAYTLELENQRLTGRIAELEAKLEGTNSPARRGPPDTPRRGRTQRVPVRG
jgi:hypothetical protein